MSTTVSLVLFSIILWGLSADTFQLFGRDEVFACRLSGLDRALIYAAIGTAVTHWIGRR